MPDKCVDWAEIAEEGDDVRSDPIGMSRPSVRRNLAPFRGVGIDRAALISLALAGVGEVAIAGVHLSLLLDDAGRTRIIGVVFGCNLFEKLVFVVTGVFFAIWLHQARRRVMRLVGPRLQFPAGVGIVFLFLPFANLVLSYFAVHDVWTACDPGPREDEDIVKRHGVSNGVLVLAWAALWAGSHVLGWAAIFSGDGVWMAAMLVIAHVLFAIDAVLAILMIGAIDRRQESLRLAIVERERILDNA